MTYRKFQATHLFTGQEMSDEDSVLVTTEEGMVQAILPAAEAGEGVDRLEGLLSPGFVNCHCHLELSHLKGLIPERTGLVDFLLAMIRERAASDKPQAASGRQGESADRPGEGNHTDRVSAAILQAEEDMLHNGIMAVGDICNTTDTLPQKRQGRLFYHNFIEAIGFLDEGADKRFAGSLAVFKEFADSYTLPIEANSIVPHAPYSVGPRLFGLITGFPGNHLLTIHNQEDETENEFYRNGKGDLTRLYQTLGIDTSFFGGTGKRSLESFLPHFCRNQALILVHNVATREEDLRFALDWQEESGVRLFFCLCPNANLYISGKLPDPELLIGHDCRIVVGTDSLASNRQLSILEELKTLQRQYPGLPATRLLQWATWNGAQALQLDSVLGGFSPGRQPGVLLIEDMKEGRFGAGSTVRRLI